MAYLVDDDGKYLVDLNGAYLVDSGGASAPGNSVIPFYTGFCYPGYTLTGFHGTWDEAVVSYAYKWQSADDNTGTNLADISGATSSTYVVSSALQGKYVRFAEAATNEPGDTSSYVASAWVQVLTIVARPAATVKQPTFDSLAGYSGDFLFNEATSDASGAATPNPVTWNTSTAAAGTFSAISICADGGSEDRSNLPCYVLLSPKFAIGGHVDAQGAIVWMNAAGTEISRTATKTYQLTPYALAIIELNATIDDIDPLPIMTAASVVVGQTAMGLEADRHLNLGTIYNVVGGYVGWTALSGDVIESGDSCKPLLISIDGDLVNLGQWVTASGSDATAENPSFFIDEICAILATQSEAPTLYTIPSIPLKMYYAGLMR